MQVLSAYNLARAKIGLPRRKLSARSSVSTAVFSGHHAATARSASGLILRFQGNMPSAVHMSRSRALQLALKRWFDLVLAVFALTVLFPLLLLVAIMVRLTSRGPALFRQDRDGLNGKVLSVLKFRSMYVDRPEVTPIGLFIRRTSIDELPQLLNVVRGDMSLVGPRPHPIGLLAAGVSYEALVPYYHARHVMKPGLSGWAQANGLRGATDNAGRAKARIEHDIAYIQNFNLLLDIRIMVRTVLREFLTGTGY